MNRPTVGSLTVPYVVDVEHRPIDFRRLDMANVERCAKHRRCGICGSRIKYGRPVAFIGPDDGRACFADPWMHPQCADLAAEQCPFIRGRGWRTAAPTTTEKLLLEPYATMVITIASGSRAHRDGLGAWHFEAIGVLA